MIVAMQFSMNRWSGYPPFYSGNLVEGKVPNLTFLA